MVLFFNHIMIKFLFHIKKPYNKKFSYTYDDNVKRDRRFLVRKISYSQKLKSLVYLLDA